MKTFVFVGSWAHRDGVPGLALFQYHEETGALEFLRWESDSISAGNTLFDSKKRIIYCAEEAKVLPGLRTGGGGRVMAYRVDETGGVSLFSCVPSYGVAASYVAVDSTGKYLVVTNHSSNNVITRTVQDGCGAYHSVIEFDDASTVLFPLHDDGSIGEPLDVRLHEGFGPAKNQKNPHPHSVVMSPCGKLFAVCDKGNDRIYMYRIDYEREKLVLCTEPYQMPAGSCPRYCLFHPTKPYFIMNNEALMEVYSFRYDETGGLQLISRCRSITAQAEQALIDAHVSYNQQDIRIHPNGKYIYNLIHGLNAVSVFEIDEETGRLTEIQLFHTDGKWPRGCAVSPDGRFLLVAYKHSNEIQTFAIGSDGKLSETGIRVSHPSCANLTFYQV